MPNLDGLGVGIAVAGIAFGISSCYGSMFKTGEHWELGRLTNQCMGCHAKVEVMDTAKPDKTETMGEQQKKQ